MAGRHGPCTPCRTLLGVFSPRGCCAGLVDQGGLCAEQLQGAYFTLARYHNIPIQLQLTFILVLDMPRARAVTPTHNIHM